MNKVYIVEVGPRDGLQNQSILVPSEIKIEWINLLSLCGFQGIEVTSFVSPKWVPQMADHEVVYQKINKVRGVHYSALVPNTKGLEKALACGVQEIAVFAAASESFSQKNTNASISESIKKINEVIKLAHQHHLKVRGYVSCIINCPYEGKVDLRKVLEVSEQLIDFGCYEVSLGDTTGKATPEEIRTLLQLLTSKIAAKKLAGHFHDTSGNALVNIAIAFDEFDIHTFDTSLNGIGGCPYAPGAKGNVATEKVVDFFRQKNVSTGIDVAALQRAKNFILPYLH